MKNVIRQSYMDFLHTWKDQHIIKVVSGVRRSGKSTLLAMFQEELLSEGTLPEQIISLNFESRGAQGLKSSSAFTAFINEKLTTSQKYYIFLDEIQLLENFEQMVDMLFVEPNVDLYVTGSNAYFLSGDMATLLGGRYVELKILPLSFSEYVTWQHENRPEKENWTLAMHYEQYLKTSFPFALNLSDEEEINTYLEGIYSTILIKDVITRNNIADTATLERITQFLYSVIGSSLSVNNIKNTLASNGLSMSPLTIEKYIKSMTDALLFYPVRRYNIRGKRLLSREEKYYTVDVGLRQVTLPDASIDAGHLLENIVYLELLRRKKHVYVGKFDDYEVDFVTIDDKQNTEYYQVSLTTLDPQTLARELRPLQKINNAYPRFLLTLDEIERRANYEGIQKVNVLDWLMKP